MSATQEHCDVHNFHLKTEMLVEKIVYFLWLQAVMVANISFNEGIGCATHSTSGATHGHNGGICATHGPVVVHLSCNSSLTTPWL